MNEALLHRHIEQEVAKIQYLTSSIIDHHDLTKLHGLPSQDRYVTTIYTQAFVQNLFTH